MKMLYTVVMEYGGGTYVSQIDASSVEQALRLWAAKLDAGAVAGLDHEGKVELVDDIEEELSNGGQPVPLTGLVNAWCASAWISGRGLMLINIIATVPSAEAINRIRLPTR
jgi:hypothetical protein